jgi:hypothetical protein
MTVFNLNKAISISTKRMSGYRTKLYSSFLLNNMNFSLFLDEHFIVISKIYRMSWEECARFQENVP